MFSCFEGQTLNLTPQEQEQIKEVFHGLAASGPISSLSGLSEVASHLGCYLGDEQLMELGTVANFEEGQPLTMDQMITVAQEIKRKYLTETYRAEGEAVDAFLAVGGTRDGEGEIDRCKISRVVSDFGLSLDQYQPPALPKPEQQAHKRGHPHPHASVHTPKEERDILTFTEFTALIGSQDVPNPFSRYHPRRTEAPRERRRSLSKQEMTSRRLSQAPTGMHPIPNAISTISSDAPKPSKHDLRMRERMERERGRSILDALNRKAAVTQPLSKRARKAAAELDQPRPGRACDRLFPHKEDPKEGLSRSHTRLACLEKERAAGCSSPALPPLEGSKRGRTPTSATGSPLSTIRTPSPSKKRGGGCIIFNQADYAASQNSHTPDHVKRLGCSA